VEKPHRGIRMTSRVYKRGTSAQKQYHHKSRRMEPSAADSTPCGWSVLFSCRFMVSAPADHAGPVADPNNTLQHRPRLANATKKIFPSIPVVAIV